jgi:hypothetical protein
MKLLLIPFLASILSASTPEINLVTAGRSDFGIVIAPGSDSLTAAAVETLREYIFKVSKAQMPVIRNPATSGKYIYIGKDASDDTGVKNRMSETGDEGFIIRITAGSIYQLQCCCYFPGRIPGMYEAYRN